MNTNKDLISRLKYIEAQLKCIRRDYKVHLENMLFVDPGGSNLSAERGNIAQPWADPWAAATHAQAGDLIYVFPGTYTVGNPGSEADFTGQYDVSFIVPNVSYYFEPGAAIEHLEAQTVSPMVYTPAENEEFTFNIYGYLDYRSNGRNFMCTILNQETASYSINVEMNNAILTGDFSLAFSFGLGIKAFNVKANYVYTGDFNLDDTGQFFRIIPNASVETVRGSLEVGTLEYSHLQPGADSGSWLLFRRLELSQIDIKVGNIIGQYTGSAALMSINNFGGIFNRNKISMQVGTMRLLNPRIVEGAYTNFIYDATTDIVTNSDEGQNKVSGAFYMYNQNASGNWNNNIINLKIGSLSGHVGINPFFNMRPLNDSTGNILSVEVDSAIMENDYPVTCIDSRNGDGNNLVNFSVRVLNTARSTSVPIITSRFGDDTHVIEYSGRFTSDDLSLPAIQYHENYSNPLTVKNFIAPSTKADGEISPRVAGSTLNVTVLGSYTASPAKNVDVTELVETPVRNSDVK